jgi:nitrogen-specific signal transduction histidine kinase
MILDHLSSAVVLLDSDLRPLYLNQAAEGLLAVSQQHASSSLTCCAMPTSWSWRCARRWPVACRSPSARRA